MGRFNREQLFGILALIFLTWAVFATSYVVKLQRDLRSQAFLRRRRGYLPKIANLKKLPEWKAFLGSSHFQAFKNSWQLRSLIQSREFRNLEQSQAWQNLYESQSLQNLINSLKITNIRQSSSFATLKQSPEFRQLKNTFSRYGTLGGAANIKAFSQSPGFKNFLASPEVKAFLISPELKSFLASPEFINFLKSPEFRNFVKSPKFKGMLTSPVFKGALGVLLGPGGTDLPLGELFEGIDLGELGLDKILGDLLKTLLESLLGGDLGIPQAGKAEVVATDSEGKPMVVRLGLPTDEEDGLLSFFSLYTYLIRGSEGVVVWNYGMTYPMGSALGNLTLADLINLLTGSLDLTKLMQKIGERCQDPSTLPPHLPTSELTINTIEQYFPGQKIVEIDLGHWHIDHSEDAPRLQKLAETKWGFRPPIRIDVKDKLYPDVDGSPGGAEQVFRDACFEDGSWEWGKDLEDGEYITGTSFQILHTGCHTFGMTNTVSDTEKIGIYDYFPPGFALSPTGGGEQQELDPLTELLFLLLEPLGDAFWGALSPVMMEDPELCGIGSTKYYHQGPAKGYPTYYVHFTKIVPADQFPPPGEEVTPPFTPTPTPRRPGGGFPGITDFPFSPGEASFDLFKKLFSR